MEVAAALTDYDADSLEGTLSFSVPFAIPYDKYKIEVFRYGSRIAPKMGGRKTGASGGGGGGGGLLGGVGNVEGFDDDDDAPGGSSTAVTEASNDDSQCIRVTKSGVTRVVQYSAAVTASADVAV